MVQISRDTIKGYVDVVAADLEGFVVKWLVDVTNELRCVSFVTFDRLT
jgi:hypothetical protein